MSSETVDGGHMENYTPVDPSKRDDGVDSPQQLQPATTSTATNLAESAKQQQDREFFRKFLSRGGDGQTDLADQTNQGESTGTKMMNEVACASVPETSVDQATKTIENLLNQAANPIGRPSPVSINSWPTAPAYSSIPPPIYSTFGFDMGYRPAASSSNSNNSNQQLQSTPTSLIYDGLFADGAESDSIFRGGLLADELTSLSSSAIKGAAGYLGANGGDILARSYAEQQLSISRQEQLLHEQVGNLSLFDSNDRRRQLLSAANEFRQQASNNYQQPGAQSRLLNSFMASTFNQSYPSTSSSASTSTSAHQMTNAVSSSSGAHRYGGGSNSMIGGGGGGGASSRSNNPAQRDGSDKIHHNFVATTTAIKSRRNKMPFFGGVQHTSEQYGGGLKLAGSYGSSSMSSNVNSSSDGNSSSSSSNNNNNSNNNNSNNNNTERFSRKVFVGGLPPDIDEEEIKASFRRFGGLIVDWPHKAESKSYFPPKGYAFLLFQEEGSVQALIDACFQEDDKLYLCVSSPTIKDKPVQIRPWRLSDTDYVLDSTRALDPRKTVFVGGVPRPLKACELATIMNNLYGGVCYAGIDTDPELKYPKGAGRVAFSNYRSYITAISARFVHIQHSELEKQVEVKPYVLDDQFCDECQDSRRANKFAPFFCANITCLRYYCDDCWSAVHSQGAGKELHKPLVKEGGDRPRGSQSFRW